MLEAGRRIGRAFSAAEARGVAHDLAVVSALPGMQGLLAGADRSPEAHRDAALRYFARAGLDHELANALYDLDPDDRLTRPFPDAAPVLAALREAGMRIAVVSDVHFDLRPLFKQHGLDSCIDAWWLSFEHGWVKPERQPFEAALDSLGVAPGEALMVGDRAERDGGAAAVGIPTLILPPLAEYGPRGLDRVLRLVG